MEMNLRQLGTQAIEASVGTKKMRLSENATSMVFQLFTKNIYSNPIGTVVREITSNCFDSHVEAKINAPVIIKKTIDSETNTIYVSFHDFGVGMSPDRVENIYGVYFESTKRVDNTQIGGFGIGGKTPLAYKRPTGHGTDEYDNSFYVITTYEGIKYSYIIFEGTESPLITLLHQEETTEHNGTEIRIPVLERDVYNFEKEMLRQLYYFENIIFEGFNDTNLTNQYQIIRGKNFLYRGNNYSDYMHVCLGRVAYPIDYNVLGLNSNDFRIPIAIKFEVGELSVVASREQLDYCDAVIKNIKKKLEIAKDEIKQLLSKQYDKIVTLNDYFSAKHDFGILRFANGMSINVNSIISAKDIDFARFRYSFIKMPNDKQMFRFFFEAKMYGKKTKSRYSNGGTFEGGYEAIKRNSNLLYVEYDYVRKMSKQSFLKHKFDNYYVISKRSLLNQSMRAEIAELFNVHLDSVLDENGSPVDYIKDLIRLQEEYFAIVREHAMNYDTLEIPEEFAKRKRNVLTAEMRNTTIPVKLFGNYNGSKERIKLDVLFKFKERIFYGIQDDEDKLKSSVTIFKTLFDSNAIINSYSEYRNQFTREKKGILFIMIAKNNLKYLQYCKNAVHIDQFYNKMLYRKADMVMNYFQLHILVNKYNELTSLYRSTEFARIDSNWGKTINNLKSYFNSMPNKNSKIGNCVYELEKHFNLKDIKLSIEQEDYIKMIDDVKMLQDINSEVLKHINLPYYCENLSTSLIDILKKVMVL